MSQSSTPSPFHCGEIALQTEWDVRRVENFAQRAIRPFMPDQHRAFFAAQPFLVVAARDKEGRPWATVLEGEPGFATSLTATELAIASQTTQGDALCGALTQGSDLGVIGIEFASRRRNRVNGRITRSDSKGLQLGVEQSYGNCPKFIQPRSYWIEDNTTPGSAHRHEHLSAIQIEWISRSDTFFIASGFRDVGESPSFGMDASHRAGPAGFVEVRSEQEICFPDYAGNNYFNTLGNIERDGRAGLLFIDFDTGSLLQLTGRAEISQDAERLTQHEGALRLVNVAVEAVVELPSALRLRWVKADLDARQRQEPPILR